MGEVLTHEENGLGIITLNHPTDGNRLSPSVLTGLLGAVEGLVSEPRVRAILLRARGPAFCLGMDFASLAGADPASRAATVEVAVRTYAGVLAAIHGASKPVLAAVDGTVKAGGVGLVSACDVVLATEESSFELGEAFFGIIPANVLPFLLGTRISLQKARYLVLTARSLGGREAQAIGLVDELYPASEMERGLRDVLKRIWRTSPAAAAEAKAFTRRISGLDLEGASTQAREKLSELLAREEVMGAISAFMAGGAPPWFAKWRPSSPLLLREGAAEEGSAT